MTYAESDNNNINEDLESKIQNYAALIQQNQISELNMFLSIFYYLDNYNSQNPVENIVKELKTRCSERFLLNTFKIENKGDSEDKYNQERCKRDGKHAMTRSLRLCVKHILETYLNKNITESISLPKDISFLFKKSDLDDNYMTTLKQIVSAISSNNSSAQLSDNNDSFSEFIINNVIKNYYPNHISSQNTKRKQNFSIEDSKENSNNSKISKTDIGEEAAFNFNTVDYTISSLIKKSGITLDSKLGHILSSTNTNESHIYINSNLKNNINSSMSEFNILQSEKGWLNDEIINDSMNILVSNNSSKNVICLSTFFYSSLAHDNTFKYLNVIKWNYNTDIFSFDKILLPINIDNMHWVLVVVFIKSSTIIYYDSLLSNSKTANLILVNILKWLKIEGEIRNRNSNLWTTTINDSIPKQENTYDCGLYIIKFAEYIIKGETLNKNTFDKDKKTFRKQILEKLQENDK